MTFMERYDYLNLINNSVMCNDSKSVVEMLNGLFETNKYKELLDITFMAISSFQLYGFLAYLNMDEQEKFLNFDFIKTAAHKGIILNFYNNDQSSLLYELEQNKKVFISAPTSFGKTSIVSEYILANYKQLNNIVFIVPTNSLLEELFQKFARYSKNLGLNYHISTQIDGIKENRNILFLTPERFLMLAEQENLDEFDLFIMDEAYKIVNPKNQTISDFINDRAIRFRKVSEILGKTENKVFFLSPFTYTETKSMAEFLKKYNITKINRTLEYVDREIINVNSKKQLIDYFLCDHNIVYNKQSKLSEKVGVILKQLQNEKNIIYVPNYNKGYELVDSIKEVKINKENKFYKRYIAFLNHLNNNYCIDGIPKWKIIEALEKGCGLYISPLPRFIKKEIIKLYENDLLSNLIVTTSFTEGVNTNAKNLIFTSLVNGPNTNKLADIDILNVAGRAGRFAKSPVGKIFCINDEIYDSVKKLQDKSIILLEHYNYVHKPNHIDYEIDMIEDKFLTEKDIFEKEQLEKEILNLGLTKSDLKTCLNVSNKWKVILYKSFLNQSEEHIKKIKEHLIDLLNEDSSKRISSIEFILKYIGVVLSRNGIEPFPMEKYEIHAFDNSDKCIWCRLYKIYCQGSSKQVIESNIKYVTKEFEEIVPNCTNKTKKMVKSLFEERNKAWILKYYKDNLDLNYNAFYSETFKFISNIIQYKIPFYLGYFISVFNLYLKKAEPTIDNQLFDVKKITISFEDGNLYDEYNDLVDFGISNDLIIKLINLEVGKDKLIQRNYDRAFFDEYENMVIDDYIELNR